MGRFQYGKISLTIQTSQHLVKLLHIYLASELRWSTKKEPQNPEFPGENQQETLHSTLIMALVLGSGFMRRTTELSPYFNYYYQKAAVPITRRAAINVRQISQGGGPKIHGFPGLAKRTEVAVGEEATAPVGFNAAAQENLGQ
ncbi:hypothetical protein NC651_027153 [Populus alba x Populus x berolinensis]|nr:hypothetical protein NC651_027153 [Populus alba x Populus x berolinensis]